MATRNLRQPSILFVGKSGDDSPERTCPQCSGVMEYRDKWPVLSTVDPNSREPRERLRYVSGWFCSDQECGYQELARRTG
jgi:hypothetical protein